RGIFRWPGPNVSPRADRTRGAVELAPTSIMGRVPGGTPLAPRRLPNARHRLRLRVGEHYLMSERRHAFPSGGSNGLNASRALVTWDRRRSGSATASGPGP